VAKWRIIYGQMAHVTATETVARRTVDKPTKDLARFRQYLRRGGPGAHVYVTLLGLETFEAADLLRAVEKGLPYRAFERFRRNTSLSLERVADLIDIPRRTMTRRKREGRFLPVESDRLVRASRLFGKTLELFEGDRDAAAEWLTTAQPALGGTIPLDLARNEVGAREVERLVGRLEHGVIV
jgi:putative toxin-antitoxin system antitoxin component (TIGR02293 family)